MYIQMMVIASLTYKSDERNQLVEKVQSDMSNIHTMFSNVLSSKDVENSMLKLRCLLSALQDSPELVPAHIVKLRVAMGKQYNDNCTVSSCNGLEMHPENEIRHL